MCGVFENVLVEIAAEEVEDAVVVVVDRGDQVALVQGCVAY